MADTPKRKPVDDSTPTRHPKPPSRPSGTQRRPLVLIPSTPIKLVVKGVGKAGNVALDAAKRLKP